MNDVLLKKLDEVVSGLRDEMTSHLQELVRIPSVTGSEGPAQEYMRKLYEVSGLDVHTITADRSEVEKHPAFCDSGYPYDGRPNVVGILKGEPDKQSIILNGHIDTVSPEPVEQWQYDPAGGKSKKAACTAEALWI